MKPALFGFVFGLVLPVFGLFVGLQVSAVVGNFMLLPMLLLSDVTGIVFGYASGLVRVLFFVFSGVWWAVVFFAGSWLMRRRKKI